MKQAQQVAAGAQRGRSSVGIYFAGPQPARLPGQYAQGRWRVQVILQSADQFLRRRGLRRRTGARILATVGALLRAGFSAAVEQHPVEPVQALPGSRNELLAPLQRVTVARAQERQPQDLPGKARAQRTDRQDIAPGLGHLRAVHANHAVVQPVSRQRRAIGAAALRDLVFVMREDQVLAAAVNIDGLSQMFSGHGRALQMPAGTPAAPGTLPTRQLIGRRLPQHEVGRILLVRRHIHPGAGNLLVAIAPGKLAVGRIGAHPEEHVTVRLVGML